MKSIRLDKYLSDMGVCTRSEARDQIKKGYATVNGDKIRKADVKINPEADEVTYRGRVLNYQQFVYYMLNKPAGVVSATEDKKDKTVLELLPKPFPRDVFPVGRLDKDTEGLLLITNDGDLAHNLLSPKKHVDKTYFAKVDGILTEEDVNLFKKGVDIGEKNLTLPATLEILSVDDVEEYSTCHITISEGKFHQIKRMCLAVGKEVMYLKRLSMGSLQLDTTLALGESRPLTDEELLELQNR
ncbi:pseudouridine synthase [Chakrabartyella piscis]|uniref:pseudouridine synthase n=1 Tax=Chakrabartyella piscis TaxID=2918914 RepID=UPI002958BA17|nr:pseudouridine synthase [Chakrabartyella piscis]